VHRVFPEVSPLQCADPPLSSYQEAASVASRRTSLPRNGAPAHPKISRLVQAGLADRRRPATGGGL